MRICSIENCNKRYLAKGYCSKHYQQFNTYGEIRERTIFDPNEFIIDVNICWVIMYNNKCIEIARSKFYTKYYETLKDYKWHIDDNGYPETLWYDQEGQHKIKLHQAIVYLSGQEVKDSEEIDHKDLNILNNLDENLRICTFSQNQQNKINQSNNMSGYKGVSWNSRAKKWTAQININNQKIYLGRFIIKEDAARAYNIAAIKYFDKFAVLNNV